MSTGSQTEARGHRNFFSTSGALYLLASVIFVGTLVACTKLWPQTPSFGYEWRLSAYLPSLGGLTLGLVLSTIFAALGRILAQLAKLVRNTGR